jgi:hypothetical protein
LLNALQGWEEPLHLIILVPFSLFSNILLG